MTLDVFIRYGSLWTLVLGVFSLAIAVRSYRRQVNAQIFFEIAGRYQQMLQSVPIVEWTSLNSAQELPPETPEMTSGVLRYLAIVHFGFTLHELHYLSRDLWNILQAEHHRTLSTPLFVREWTRGLCREFAFFPPFVRYVDSIQNGRFQAPGSHTESHKGHGRPGLSRYWTFVHSHDKDTSMDCESSGCDSRNPNKRVCTQL